MGCGSSTQTSGETDKSSAPSSQAQPTATSDAATESARSPRPEKAPAADKPSGNDFLEKGVRIHNELRAKHGAVPLTPSAELTKFSQKWADHLAKIDNMEHSTNKMRKDECRGAGENLYYCWSSDPNAGVTAEDATQSWYDEINDYNFNSPGFAMDTGHFTQVVWKGSKELGMAWAKSKKGSYFVVANYKPAGNMMGDFETNVVPSS